MASIFGDHIAGRHAVHADKGHICSISTLHQGVEEMDLARGFASSGDLGARARHAVGVFLEPLRVGELNPAG